MADNPLLALHAERTAALAALGFRAGAPPPPLAVLYTALQVAPLRRVFAWGVPSPDALAAVARHSPRGVVDAGAGTGYWAALLRGAGVDVLPYDAAPLDDGATHNGHHALPRGAAPPPFLRVRRGDAAAAAAAHPERTLLLCWPPPEACGDRDGADGAPAAARSMAADALASFAGDTVVYVGEGAPGGADEQAPPGGGATAGPVFHGALARGWALEAHVPLPRWPSVRS
jgi:hypothetical protein